MYKLIILIEDQDDWERFDAAWPQFLHEAERMPGLQREVTSRVGTVLFGNAPYVLIHELYFDSQQAAQQAMASEPGSRAGHILQQITKGRMTLLFADHREDDIENIRRYQQSAEVDDESANPV